MSQRQNGGGSQRQNVEWEPEKIVIMPKVGKIKVVIPGHLGREYSLYYSQKTKFYITEIPADFINLTDFITERYETEASLKDNLMRCVRLAKEKLLTERKVIVFNIAASTHLTCVKEGEGHYSGQLPGISERISKMSFGPPLCTFGVEYYIYTEFNDGVQKAYHQINPDGSAGQSRRVTDNFTVIDWSEQREAFFESIYQNMAETLQKLSAFFFTDHITSVLDAIDHKQLKLYK